MIDSGKKKEYDIYEWIKMEMLFRYFVFLCFDLAKHATNARTTTTKNYRSLCWFNWLIFDPLKLQKRNMFLHYVNEIKMFFCVSVFHWKKNWYATTKIWYIHFYFDQINQNDFCCCCWNRKKNHFQFKFAQHIHTQC